MPSGQLSAIALRLTGIVSCELEASGAKGTEPMLLGTLCSKSRNPRDAAAIPGEIKGSAAGGCGVGVEVIVLRPAGIPIGGGVACGRAG